MALEIERKFLVDAEKWQESVKPEGRLFRQGYLSLEPNRSVRVRLTPEKGFLTIKGETSGATRSEFEYEIPVADAYNLLDRLCVSELSKIRYVLEIGGKVWEVDEYLGDNAGLILAEIELTDEQESYAQPPWVGAEVTDQPEYYNVSLASTPFKSWKKQ